ncbi:MAG: GxxExxY protein [Bacteroidales bacterium]|nr:GxxExxY protein [Bacteroidales bacterium]
MLLIDNEAAKQSGYIHKELTEQIIHVFYDVYNTLGYGFVENVYQNAMFFALKEVGFSCEAQKEIDVFFRGHKVGIYKADIVVNNSVLLELKAVAELNEAHKRQLSNYLKATNVEVGLLLNFGENPQVRRWIYTNDKK